MRAMSTACVCPCSHCVLDFTIEYRTQSANDSYLFLRIKAAIYGLQASIVYVCACAEPVGGVSAPLTHVDPVGCTRARVVFLCFCVVVVLTKKTRIPSYVRGLARVSDTLWKWCAEFTQRHPWVFIFFEDTDTSFLLPENVDRCIDELAGHADRNRFVSRVTSGRVDTTLQPVVYADIGYPEMEPNFHLHSTRLNDAWEQELTEADFLSSRDPIVITGPAGIGKTYFIKHEFLCRPSIVEEFFQVTKDGSNDEFLSSTVGDVLQHDIVDRLREMTMAQRAASSGGGDGGGAFADDDTGTASVSGGGVTHTPASMSSSAAAAAAATHGGNHATGSSGRTLLVFDECVGGVLVVQSGYGCMRCGRAFWLRNCVAQKMCVCCCGRVVLRLSTPGST